LAMVATGGRKSVNDAYRARKEQLTVSVTSVYSYCRKIRLDSL